MSDSRGLGLTRAWRVIGLFAPVSIMVAVVLAALAIASPTWSMWAVGAFAATAVAAAGWLAFRRESTLVRIAVTLACEVISGLAAYLVFFGVWQLASGSNDGLIQSWVMYAFVCFPWVALVVAGTFALRAGNYEGAPHGSLYWTLAIVASGFAYPLVGWVTAVANADDMSALVLFFIPAAALCLWAGPAAVMLVKGGRRPSVASGGAAVQRPEVTTQ